MATGGRRLHGSADPQADQGQGDLDLAARPSWSSCSKGSAARNDRPLLKNVDQRTKLSELIDLRYPIYAEADCHGRQRRRPAPR